VLLVLSGLALTHGGTWFPETSVRVPLPWARAVGGATVSVRTHSVFLLASWLLATGATLFLAASEDRFARFRRRLGQLPKTFAVSAVALVLAVLLPSNLRNPWVLLPALPLTVTLVGALASWEKLDRAWPRLAAVILGSAAALLVGEILFRAVLLDRKVPTDEVGFERWIASSWPRGVGGGGAHSFRIVSLADSFGTNGGARNYHLLLQKKLRASGLDVEVVPFACDEYEAKDELELLERFGPLVKPDLVLHAFFVGNDFYVPPGELVAWHGVSVRSPNDLLDKPLRNLLLIEWTRRFLVAGAAASGEGGEITDDDTRPTFTEDAFLGIERQRFLDIATRSPPPEERWRETVPILEKIRSTARNFGADYALLIHPDQFQVERELRESLIARTGVASSDVDLDAAQRFLTADAVRASVPVVDLLPEFRRVGERGGLYRNRDTHYSTRGNELAADLAAEALRERIERAIKKR
jgi:hypothetical protein